MGERRERAIEQEEPYAGLREELLEQLCATWRAWRRRRTDRQDEPPGERAATRYVAK